MYLTYLLMLCVREESGGESLIMTSFLTCASLQSRLYFRLFMFFRRFLKKFLSVCHLYLCRLVEESAIEKGFLVSRNSQEQTVLQELPEEKASSKSPLECVTPRDVEAKQFAFTHSES